MFDARSWMRHVVGLVVGAMTMLFADALCAQTIDLSLNVFYTNPAAISSGGTWELVARSTNFGIAGIKAKLANVNNGSQVAGPRGTVNGSNVAGFQLLSDVPHVASPPTPAYHELTIGQVPIAPNSLPAGNEETLFYGVGTLTNGAPNYPGKPPTANFYPIPAFTSLTNPQAIPWATGDAFNDAAWATGARMVSGTFASGVTPAFVAGNTGNVFTSLPANNTTLGNDVAATSVTAIVRTNFAPSADYNHNGIVDAADYVVWRNTLNNVVPAGTGADGDNSGVVDQGDYTLWRSHFGLPSGAGSGASVSAGNVPEPGTFTLLALGGLLAMGGRRARARRAVRRGGLPTRVSEKLGDVVNK